MNAGTKDPDRGIGSVPVIGWASMARVCDYGSQKRLCRLYNVRKLYRPSSLLYRAKFARDRFARCDTLQQLYADGFFHDEYYADLSQTCSRLYETRGARASNKLYVDRDHRSRLQRAPDGCGDGAKAWNEPGENFRRERLVTIALGLLGRIMDFDHEGVGAGGNSSERHLRHELAETKRVRWVDDHRQMRF